MSQGMTPNFHYANARLTQRSPVQMEDFVVPCLLVPAAWVVMASTGAEGEYELI